MDGEDELSDDARAFLALLAAGARRLPPPPQPTDQDLADIRVELGLSEDNTLAAAGTNIPALAGESFVGLSPALRRDAGLPSLDELHGKERAIKSPNPNPIASRHAEEDILNAVHARIEAEALDDEDLEGGIVNIHISNETGICHTCFGGLGTSRGRDGVLKQFSLLHPTLTLRITAQGGNARADMAVVLVRNGVLVDS